MTPHVYHFQSDTKQQVVFRGYVKEYHGSWIQKHNCTEVRMNKKAAMDDAVKLLKNLRKQRLTEKTAQ